METSVFLEESGHESFVAFASGYSNEKSLKMSSVADSMLHGFFSRLTGKQAYFSMNETRKLLKFIDEIKPNVVHLRNLHSNYINLNTLLKYLALNDIPTVLTLHDCWFYTGKCTHYTLDNCYKWKSECNNCPRLKKDNPSWFFDKTTEMYSDKKENFGNIKRLAVVGVSDWITNEAKMSFLSNSKILRRIYNWVDLDIFKPSEVGDIKRKLGIEKKFVILGVASRWSEEKGLNTFIDLANNVSKDIAIVLVGNIESSTVLPPNIISIQETHDIKELVQYYSLADVFLNLSLEESFGKVTAESLACGTPVIVLNSTANPELVGDGCGVIIEDKDIQNLVTSIENIKLNGKNMYKDKCIDFAHKNFSKYDRLNDYLTLYKDITNS
ncbi:glycosyltransferase [Planococcus beigongshangi]|uniref:glycosyltransferase n=1 Tax=Planococcus beigongshangi TaxID=2782536 RepID=UPI00193B14E9|nr:glycosyltransferase [Planococcus beigongshangi]